MDDFTRWWESFWRTDDYKTHEEIARAAWEACNQSHAKRITQAYEGKGRNAFEEGAG